MDSLLNSLRKYRPRDNSDPLENFVTEAFAWLLKAEPRFSDFFISLLNLNRTTDAEAAGSGAWTTQRNLGGVYPDMVWESSDEKNHAYIFEHKIWSPLHDNQLDNYRSRAQAYYPGGYKVILITAHKGQHTQSPDEAYCWSDVYLKIEGFLSRNSDVQHEYLFRDFLKLLENLGLAPHGCFKTEEIIGYSYDFNERMKRLWAGCIEDCSSYLQEKLGNELPQSIDARAFGPIEHYGLTGIRMFDELRPSLFIGALLDPRHYHVQHSNASKDPDCCIIISFEDPFHADYATEAFQALTRSLEIAFESKPNGWSFYNHLEDTDCEEKNLWHPLYIRKPLLEVLSFGQKDASIQAQSESLHEAIKQPLEILFDQTGFLAFRGQKKHLAQVTMSPELLSRRLMAVLQKTPIIETEIRWHYSTMYLCITFKNEESETVGFNLEFMDRALKFWLFNASASHIDAMKERLQQNAPGMPFSITENQVVILNEDLQTNSITQVYESCHKILRASGFKGSLPDIKEVL